MWKHPWKEHNVFKKNTKTYVCYNNRKHTWFSKHSDGNGDDAGIFAGSGFSGCTGFAGCSWFNSSSNGYLLIAEDYKRFWMPFTPSTAAEPNVAKAFSSKSLIALKLGPPPISLWLIFKPLAVGSSTHPTFTYKLDGEIPPNVILWNKLHLSILLHYTLVFCRNLAHLPIAPISPAFAEATLENFFQCQFLCVPGKMLHITQAARG